MEDFMTLAKARYSVGKYKDTPIEDEKLDKIIEAGIIAPTAHNEQPWRCYVLRSPEALKKINDLTACAFHAPVVLMFTYNKDEQWKNPLEEGVTAGQEDVSIVATHMMLEAWELGIGSCWVNYFPNTKTEEAFNLPDNERVVLLMPMGYAQDGVHAAHLHNENRSKDELVKTL